MLIQKFPVGLRLVYRCPFVSAKNLYTVTSEHSLEHYVKRYFKRRLKTMHVIDLGLSPFYNDIFFWDDFFKRKGDNPGHFFRGRCVQQLIHRHQSYLVKWIFFTESD